MNKVVDNKLLARVALPKCMVTMLILLSQMPEPSPPTPRLTITHLAPAQGDAGPSQISELYGTNFQDGDGEAYPPG